jgi:hypothetical protein
MKQVRRYLPALAVPALGLSSITPAFAAFTAPAAFTGAISDATEAVGILAGALIGVAAAAVVIMIVYKYVKRVKGAG